MRQARAAPRIASASAVAATCEKEGIARGQLTLHADRGTSMRSKPVALLLADLGVTKSHSRPHDRAGIGGRSRYKVLQRFCR